MKVPAFIKQLAKFCDLESSRYALAGIKCESDGKVAKMTATDGRALVCAHWNDDGPAMDVIVDGEQLASAPPAAFKPDASGDTHVTFDGTTLKHGNVAIQVAALDGRFPRVEDVFDAIYRDRPAYTAVKLNSSYLRTLCDLATAVSCRYGAPHITLWVRPTQAGGPYTAVAAESHAVDGSHTIRMALMQLGVDSAQEYEFPARPGTVPAAEKPTAESAKRGRKAVAKKAEPAPPPEMMTATQVAAAVADDLATDLPPI